MKIIQKGGGTVADEKAKDQAQGASPDGDAQKRKSAVEEIDRVQAKKKLAARAQRKKAVSVKEDLSEPKARIAARKAAVPVAGAKRPTSRDIGVDFQAPEAACNDIHCPFHGKLPLRGQAMDVVVISNRMTRTAVVQRQLTRTHPKFERQLKITHRYLAHNPDCIAAKPGEAVRIMECRPISKKKSFAIIGRL